MAATVSITITGTNRSRPAFREASDDLGGLQRVTEGVTKGIKTFGDGLGTLGDQLRTTGQQATLVGDVLTNKITQPLLKIGGTALDVGMDYQSAMSMLQTNSEATAEEMDALAKAAKDLGSDMSLPGTSAADAATAMLELNKAGLSVNNTLGAAKGVLQLSAAGALSNAEAAEIAANALNAFKLSGDKAAMVADLFAATASKSSVEVKDVADSFEMASAVFSGFQGAVVGPEQAVIDLTAAIGVLGNVGLKGSDAGTSLKTALLMLTAPSDKSKALMKELAAAIGETGDIAYRADGSMRPFREILDLTARATRGMTDEQRNFAITEIYGADASRAIIGLLQQGLPVFDSFRDTIQKQGAAGELAGARMTGLRGAIEGFKSTVETAMLNAVEPFLPKLEAMVRYGADLVGKFDALDSSTKLVVVSLLAMAAAVGPLLIGLGAFLSLLGLMATGLSVLVSPVGLVVGGLGSLAAAFVVSHLNAEGVIQGLRNLIANFKQVAPAIDSPIRALRSLGDTFKTLVTGESDIVGSFYNDLYDSSLFRGNLQELGRDGLTELRKITADWQSALKGNEEDPAGDLYNRLFNSTTFRETIQDAGRDGLIEFRRVFENNPLNRSDKLPLEGSISSFRQALLDLPKTAETAMGKMVRQIRSQLPDWEAGLSSWGKALLGWVGDALPKLPGQILRFRNAAVDDLLSRLPGWIDALGKWGAELVNWIGPKILPMLGEIGRAQADLVRIIVDRAPAIGAALLRWGEKFVAWIGPKIEPMLGELGKLIDRGAARIGEKAPVIGEKLAQWGEKFVAWIGPKIEPMMIELGKLIDRAFTWISERAPIIAEKLGAWGDKFAAWVGPAAGKLLIEAGKLLGNLLVWIFDNRPKLQEGLLEWSKALAWMPSKAGEWIGDAMGGFLRTLKNWVTKTAVPDMQKDGTMGRAVVDGLVSGFSVEKMITDLVAKIKAADWKAVVDAILMAINPVAAIGSQISTGIITGITGIGSNSGSGGSSSGSFGGGGNSGSWGGSTGSGSGGGSSKPTTPTTPTTGNTFMGVSMAKLQGGLPQPTASSPETGKLSLVEWQKLWLQNYNVNIDAGRTVSEARDAAWRFMSPNYGMIPKRERGGPVLGGGLYLVGERGPELLSMGSMGGMVTPNSGGAVSIAGLIGALNGLTTALQRAAAGLTPGGSREQHIHLHYNGNVAAPPAHDIAMLEALATQR